MSECLFDGSCELCRDGDITLQLDDSTLLKAHSFILKKASPLLKTIIEECAHNGTIEFRFTSKEVWITILQELYPAEHTRLSKLIFVEPGPFLDELLCVARKFQIEGVVQSVDTLITSKLALRRQGFDVHASQTASYFIDMATKYKLEKSEVAGVEYIIREMSGRDLQVYTRFGGSANIAESFRSFAGPSKLLLNTDNPALKEKFLHDILAHVLRMNVD